MQGRKIEVWNMWLGITRDHSAVPRVFFASINGWRGAIGDDWLRQLLNLWCQSPGCLLWFVVLFIDVCCIMLYCCSFLSACFCSFVIFCDVYLFWWYQSIYYFYWRWLLCLKFLGEFTWPLDNSSEDARTKLRSFGSIWHIGLGHCKHLVGPFSRGVVFCVAPGCMGSTQVADHQPLGGHLYWPGSTR